MKLLKKIVFVPLLVILGLYILLWLLHRYTGSATQCGDGFGTTWHGLLLVESFFLVMFIFCQERGIKGLRYYTVIGFSLFMLVSYTWMGYWVIIKKMQHCGASDYFPGEIYRQGLDAIWPIFFICLHVGHIFFQKFYVNKHSQQDAPDVAPLL